MSLLSQSFSGTEGADTSLPMCGKDYSFLLVSLNLSFLSFSFIRLEAICTRYFRNVWFDVWLYKPMLEDMEYILVGRASIYLP